jgi:hypothetical protein
MLTSYFYNNSDNFKNAISMNAFTDVDNPKAQGRVPQSVAPRLATEKFSAAERRHI